MDTATVLLELEKSLLSAEVRRDSHRVASLLSEEFREVGSSGRVWTKPEIVAELYREAFTPTVLTDFAFERLGDDYALVTYRTCKGEGAARVEALRSSVWVWRGDHWQMQFHQGTRVTA